jgi:hypothetical protein
MPQPTLLIRASATALLFVAGCTVNSNPAVESVSPPVANTLTPSEAADGWRLLFDGRSIDQWRGYKQTTVPAGWHVSDGTMTKEKPTGDLVSRDQFGNFELAWDWKLSEGGNSGMFFRGTEEYDYIFWSAPEYQLLDDAKHPDGKLRLTAAGSAFGLYPAPAGVVHPAGEWNSSLLIVRGNHVEHWMNGVKMLEYELKSPEWEAKVKASKFGKWPNYGRHPSGYLGIQGDHDGLLALRSIRIRELR